MSREQFIQLQNLSDMLKGIIGVGSTLLGFFTSNLDQIEAGLRREAQIIGLIKSRLSGITLSRHAYADVLRTIYPDLMDVTVSESRRNSCRVNVWAARPLSRLVLGDFQNQLPGFNVWCVVLESTNLPEGSLDACSNAGQVWVPSSFVRDVCVAGGMPAEKVRLVPYFVSGPDRARVPPDCDAAFTALVSWDGRSSMNRKNVISSVRAFKMAWPKDRSVRLRLKTRDLSEDNTARLLAEVDGDPRIELDTRTVDSVDEIFDKAHVLLHITRAEGYGRHIIEAMQRRLPVIATRYSGGMDWLTDQNSWLVDGPLVETAQQEFQYPQGGLWCEPTIEQTACHLLDVKRRHEAGSLLSVLDAAELAALKHTSLEQSRNSMLDALRDGGVM